MTCRLATGCEAPEMCEELGHCTATPSPKMDDSGLTREQAIREAVARGWCDPANSYKEMDATLAESIVREVLALRQDSSGGAGLAGAAHDPSLAGAALGLAEPGAPINSVTGELPKNTSTSIALNQHAPEPSVDYARGLGAGISMEEFTVPMAGPASAAPEPLKEKVARLYDEGLNKFYSDIDDAHARGLAEGLEEAAKVGDPIIRRERGWEEENHVRLLLEFQAAIRAKIKPRTDEGAK